MKVLFIAIILMLLNACKKTFSRGYCAFICQDVYGFGKCNVGNDIPVYFTDPKYREGNIAIGM